MLRSMSLIYRKKVKMCSPQQTNKITLKVYKFWMKYTLKVGTCPLGTLLRPCSPGGAVESLLVDCHTLLAPCWWFWVPFRLHLHKKCSRFCFRGCFHFLLSLLLSLLPSLLLPFFLSFLLSCLLSLLTFPLVFLRTPRFHPFPRRSAAAPVRALQ